MANGPYEFISTFQTDPFEEQRLAAERQRRMAELLAQQSEQFGQYQTPRGPLGEVRYPVSQGLAQLATAIGGAFKRGRAEREEAALREQERAARTDVNELLNKVTSGKYELPTDRTLSDTALPGELPSASNMSILEQLQSGFTGLSPEAQEYLSPMLQQLSLSEAMSEQERQRELEDFAAREAIEKKFREKPETYRQLGPDELPPGARFGQQNVVTGEIEYDWTPASIVFGDTGGSSPRVQSSQPYLNGTTIMIMNDGTRQVVDPTGRIVTGQEAADVIQEANRFGIAYTGQGAGARAGATNAQEVAAGSFAQYNVVNANIKNLGEALRLVKEEGANTGPIMQRLPDFTNAAIELRNIQQNLGLDIVAASKFGALSEGELNLALDTALPTGLREDELISFLERKIAAQNKLSNALQDQIIFLSTPGNTIGDYVNRIMQPESPTATGGQGSSYMDQAREILLRGRPQ